MTSASRPVARKAFTEFSTPDKVDCTSSMEPPAANKPAADSHSGSSTNRPSTPAFHAHVGPAVIGMTSVSPAGGVGTYGGVDTMTSKSAGYSAPEHDPSRTSITTPAWTALPREQRTACGQISNAVTLAAPSSAAAMATTPLPVHRSN